MRKTDVIKMRIARVKKEIRDTPYDKASEHHHGRLKAKLARLRDQLDGGGKGGGGGGLGYAIKHSGDASVVLVGLPSVGKSSLLNKLTNAESKVGNYDFTTLGVVPGMMEYKGVRIQLLDLPGIITGASKNKGFGKKVLSVIRAADLVVLITDVDRRKRLSEMEDELYRAGIRLGQRPVKIRIEKRARGAIQVIDPYKSMSKETVVGVAKELGYSNALIQFEERVSEIDRLVDALLGKRKYMPVVRLVNKIDLAGSKRLPAGILPISVFENKGLEKLKKELWQQLGLVRIYLKKERNKKVDKKAPLIMKKGDKLSDVLEKISSQMKTDVKRAYIWGSKARFPGQGVSVSYRVFDEMEVWFGR